MAPPPDLAPLSRTITLAQGLRIHYFEAGDPAAPTLVLIHGLGDEADTWRHVLHPLAATHRVIALDLPGFGRSDHPRRAYTLVFFAQTVAQLLAALGVERATLVGSSLGAAVAQRLALGRPDLVERLVLSGGALPVERGRPPAALWWFLAPGVGEAVYTSLRRSQNEAYATLRPYYADLEALPAADRAFLRERVWARVWSAGQRRAFLSALRWLTLERALRAPELRRRLVGLAVPTVLIWGEFDHIVARAEGEAMAALLPNARLEVISAAGHLPHQERPDTFVAVLERTQ
ncbi:MAG: alpha/beta fold hydrolase [Chloroflexales bacterium]|nr:alpha/beta fold hydrolase [Chloroflexales bacterium]